MWQLTTVSRNGTDITDVMDFSQFKIHLKKDGNYSIENYLPFVVRHDGKWNVDDAYFHFTFTLQRKELRIKQVQRYNSLSSMVSVISSLLIVRDA